MEKPNRHDFEEEPKDPRSDDEINEGLFKKIINGPRESHEELMARIYKNPNPILIVSSFGMQKISAEEIAALLVEKDSQDLKNDIITEIDLHISLFKSWGNRTDVIQDESVPSLGITHDEMAPLLEADNEKSIENLRDLRERVQKIIV